MHTMQYLISTPSAAAPVVGDLEKLPPPTWYIGADPAGQRLGSGGGSAHLLLSAWRETAKDRSFSAWLQESRKIMIHGGGQSRRLPAYAVTGKLFVPMPVWRWSTGQRLDQKLLDLQLPYLERIFAGAPLANRLMIVSGDALVHFSGPLPVFPEADVICIGLWGKPEDARHFGVFFSHRNHSGKLAFFRQKPAAAEIQRLAHDHVFLLDAGIWMLNERAIKALLELGGHDGSEPYDGNVSCQPFELYSDFGLGLGDAPAKKHSRLNALTAAVIPLDDGEFYHIGRSPDLIESALRLQNRVLNQNKQRFIGIKRHPDMFTQNARIDIEWAAHNHRIWIENSHVGAGWELTTDHVLTGIPRNDWALQLSPGVCLDFVPVDRNGSLAVRCYGIHDEFRGTIGDATPRWMGRPAGEWFQRRGLSLAQAGITGRDDIQEAPLFPVLQRKNLSSDFLQWLVASDPAAGIHAGFATTYIKTRRIAACALGERADLETLYRQRREYLADNLKDMALNYKNSVFHRADLARTAELYTEHDLPLPPPIKPEDADLMTVVHDNMFRAETLRRRNDPAWIEGERKAFELLRDAVLDPVREQKLVPRCDVAPDQLVWSRCPVRLDFAGGWTDTPPYCQIYGGQVVNLAVNLNGQPPLQTFIRRCDIPHIVLRSIDLGSQTTLTSYKDIADCALVGNEFSIAKAALAIAGFHPDFNGGRYVSLERQLRAFGGGMEMSFVAAVPKGSGLGTSSILGATMLGALADFCDLEWDRHVICNRTLALEQVLTSGGGWQDQFGGALHGLKLIETDSGIHQLPRIKWLPERMLVQGIEQGIIMLYYTGVTRVAKDILKEIVRSMFLNERRHLLLLEDIRHHARETYDVLQSADWDGFCRAIHRSRQLNQQLDSGTNPPEIQQILDRIGDWSAGAKLLGAGGGGYLLICAKDAEATACIKRELTTNPPNPRARIVAPEISGAGLQVTRS